MKTPWELYTGSPGKSPGVNDRIGVSFGGIFATTSKNHDKTPSQETV